MRIKQITFEVHNSLDIVATRSGEFVALVAHHALNTRPSTPHVVVVENGGIDRTRAMELLNQFLGYSWQDIWTGSELRDFLNDLERLA